jgi:oxygen-dependent protoporphyrinogen oxidase
MDPLKVAIVGGGLAGLSAAHYLQQLGQDAALDLDITVLEKQARWGGKVNTLRQQDFLIEEGPDSFLVAKPWALELCRELGIDDDLVPTLPARHRTYVLTDGKLLPLPGGLERMLPADAGALLASPLFSWPGKLRILLEVLLPPRQAPSEESLESLIRRRLGREAYEKLFEPLMAGVYGADGGALSAPVALPHLPALEAAHGSLLRGARHLRRERRSAQPAAESSAFMAPRAGMGALVDALLVRLAQRGVRLLADAAVAQLSHKGQRFLLEIQGGSPLTADVLILALPAHAAAGLLAPVAGGLARELVQIPFAPATTVSLAYDRRAVPRPLDAYGYLIPRGEQRAAMACTWVSAKFPDRAPGDAALFRLFFNQASPASQSTGYVDLARRELAETLGIQGEPHFAHVSGWGQAMPQYSLGHIDRLERIESHLAALPGFFLAGNAYYGIGIPDTVRHSREVARQALAWLQLASIARAGPLSYEH